MNKTLRSIIAVFLPFIMLLPLLMGTMPVRAENTKESSQTIDGKDRNHGIEQIQSVIPDYNFASAVYDALKSRNHFGDGTQSVKDVLAAYTGNIYADGYMIKTIYCVMAKKINNTSGDIAEQIEKEFDSKQEADSYMETLTDTAEFSYTDKFSYSYQKNTMLPKDDDEMIHDITGIEWLRNADTIYLRQNKISDLSPLDINYISTLVSSPAAGTGETWFGDDDNVYIDFRENPISKYPSTMAGKLEFPRLTSAIFKLEAKPYILIKENQADNSRNASIEIPLIERDGERIDIRDNGCRILENNIVGSAIDSYTNKIINFSGLAHSGNIRIKIEGGDTAQINYYTLKSSLDTTATIEQSGALNFEFTQSIRIYSPVFVVPSSIKTTINLEKFIADTEAEGAVFRLYTADIMDGNYIPDALYSEKYYSTDRNGKITIEEELPSGDYCLIEETVPEHYTVKPTSFGFSVRGGTVTLTGGTPSLTPTGKNNIEASQNTTYIDRYSPNVSLTVTPDAENTLEKIVVTYFDRQEQNYKEITFNENNGNASYDAETWINSNKGDNDNPGLIDGNVSIQAYFRQTPLNYSDISQNTGGITVSNTISGNAADKTKKFSFTVTLGKSTVNGSYGEMDFVNGISSFELTDNESISANKLPQGISYKVTLNNSDDYTVTSSNADGIIKAEEIISVAFNNHKDYSETTENESGENNSESNEPGSLDSEETSTSSATSTDSNHPESSINPTISEAAQDQAATSSDLNSPESSINPATSEAEQAQSSESTGDSPNTSDKADAVMFYILLTASALVLAAMLPVLTKKKQ